MIFSKITSKYQATIPKKIRSVLKVKAGDRIIFEIQHDGSVIIRKTAPLDREYLRSLESTLSEWESENDETAYRDL